MHRKYTYEEVKKFVENLDYELISLEHRNNDIKLILKDKIGFYYCCFNFKSLKNKKFIFVGKNNLYSIQNIKLWLKINNPKFILVSDKYIEAKENLLLTDSDGYFYVTTWSKLYNHKCYPNAIDMRNPYIIYNLKLWLKLNNKPFELVSVIYEDANKNLQWRCLKKDCGEIFEMTWGNLYFGQNCSFCSGVKVGLSNCLATLNQELAKEWHPTKNGDLTPFDITLGSNKDVWW